MSLSLSNLKAAGGKGRKRVGRGDGSRQGTYSGRGQKGQRARSGGRHGLKRRGLKQFLQQIPKRRGFQSFYPGFLVINLSDLEKKFKEGELVTVARMRDAGLLKEPGRLVKILGQGKLVKKLNVQAHGFSKSAKDAIMKAGGTAQVIR